MTRDSLRFEELRIRRMPGFETRGFTIPELSPGINLIHGPNGSGKSTTARAVARLLWPSLATAEHAAVSGRFRLDAAEWEMDVDGGRWTCRREGVEVSPPSLPPVDGHQRYHLSLHDLLREGDESFASAIVHESAGGYDVRRAAQVLDPREVRNRRIPEQEALEQARAELDRAVADQRTLRVEEERLAELHEQESEARQAHARTAVLAAALERAGAQAEEADARAALARFPAELGRLGGDEYERICRMRERLREIAGDTETAAEAAERAGAAIEQAGIPASALGEELVDGLEEDREALRELEREAAQAERAGAAAAAKLAEERDRLPGAMDDAHLAALDAAAMRSLATYARRAEAVRAERLGLEEQLALLGEPGATEDVHRLDDGIRLLQRWLTQPAPGGGEGTASRRIWRTGVAAALGLVLLGVGLALAESPWFAVVAGVGAVLLWLLRPPASQAAPDAREVHRADFEKLGLDGPAGWETRGVEDALARLRDRAAAARAAEEIERWRREVRERLRGKQASADELEAERTALEDRLGVEPGIDAGSLTVRAEALSRWQAAYTELHARQREGAVAAEQLERIAAGLRARLAEIGYASIATSGEIAGAIQAFRARRHALERAEHDLEQAERDGRRLAGERHRIEEDARSIFAALGLGPDADETLRDWCEWRATYLEARDRHLAAQAALQQADSRLGLQGGDEALAARPLAELELELGEARARAEGRDGLLAEISRTGALVEKAKRSHSIEEALARVDAATVALREARDREVRGAIARELLAWLERATRDQHLPAVFHRARELFTRITHGRYTLRLRQEEDPRFTALDNVERRERELDELSSGSRVQLLVAVRIAFVERQEQGVKLPLILDEVLGNADDERARAIMEATLELAREGRQIFYFTAQADEVARWRALAGASGGDVELKEIDLRRVRGLEAALEIPALSPTPRRVPPTPGGADHGEYGRRLAVPRLDRASAEVASVHLWYLVEEPERLHRLLLLGSERWGPLEALLRDGGRSLVEEEVLPSLELAVRATEAFLEAARVGVGLPVDRAVLEDSGAVSSIFLDRVAALAAGLGGDGVRLMEALEEGEIRGFLTRNKEILREYLEEHGHCPAAMPLEFEEIRGRVLARMGTEMRASGVGIEEIDRLLDRLWIGVGAGDAAHSGVAAEDRS